MPATTRFALNHMAAPRLPLDAFCALAARLGIDAVEIRNDLEGNAILDGTPAGRVREMTARHDLKILSINALQKFDRWDAAREGEAVALADYAAGCGAEALVLVPANDGSGRGEDERQENLRAALEGLAPILRERQLIGLVEPLGFATSSLRSKREAVEAIKAVGGDDRFRLVHDTFHHHLAGEPELFPAMTGLVHISGLEDEGLSVEAMRDKHRVLVGRDDRLANLRQMRELLAAGYDGFFSFEPFAPSVHDATDPVHGLEESMAFLRDTLAAGGEGAIKEGAQQRA